MSEQEKEDQKYIIKQPGSKEKYTNKRDTFYRKTDTRNHNSIGTINGLHNNMPLTKEHQLKIGAGQSKPTSNNPKGYSKKQITVLNLLLNQDP